MLIEEDFCERVQQERRSSCFGSKRSKESHQQRDVSHATSFRFSGRKTIRGYSQSTGTRIHE